MLIAILSDSHDNTENITKAISMIKERGITHAFHLGDFTSPSSVLHIAESGITWQCVWGNMDIDKEISYKLIASHTNLDMAEGDFRELEIDGKKILLTHYPQIARVAALSGKYDACFHGHTHMEAQETLGQTLLANPGETCGYRYGKAMFGIYDTESGKFENILIYQ
jgi:putative phosphoesterase